jgi:hypothetical protein
VTGGWQTSFSATPCNPLCNPYYYVCKHFTNKVEEKRKKIKFLRAFPYHPIERCVFPEKKIIAMSSSLRKDVSIRTFRWRRVI